MVKGKLQIYHHLPPVIRYVVASARGYYLRSWRYGAETDKLVQEALERDLWTIDQWKMFRETQLAYTLNRAVTHVPYYRDYWSKRRRMGDKASWEVLENWPILDKEFVRSNPTGFVADDCKISAMFHEHTSGTTGKSIDLWWSRATVRKWYALFEARWRHWYGVGRNDRWAILGGQLVTPINQKTPPFWVWNQGMNQLYMSSYHLSQKFLPQYIDALNSFKIKYIYGYTSSIYLLAQAILHDSNFSAPDIQVIITNAEPLYDYQRQTIEKAFGCPVRETYGMAEIVGAASECERGKLHWWPEVGILELAEVDQVISNLNEGELICTSILNQDMPLIRYRVGDRAIVSTDNTPCECGRLLPRLSSIEGRQDDLLYTIDGRRVGRLDPVFKAEFPIIEAQIIQEKVNFVKVLVVPDNNFRYDTTLSIRDRLHDRLGKSMEIEIEIVDRIPRTSNGKFRAVICNLTLEDRRMLEWSSPSKIE